MQPAPPHKKSSRTVLEKAMLSKQKSSIKISFVKELENYLKGQTISFSTDEALDSIVYGISCTRAKRGELYNTTIMLISNSLLSVISRHNHKVEYLDLYHITVVSFDKTIENFKTIQTIQEGTYIHFLTKQRSFDFIFPTSSQLNMFITGIIDLLDESKEEVEDLPGNNDTLEDYILQLWRKYDQGFTNRIDREEFRKFAQELNVNFEKNVSLEQLFMAIDKDNSGYIEYKEFVQYYLKFTSGEEFRELFMKYSKGKDTLKPEDLGNFFINEQKEEVKPFDCIKIILSFKQGINEQKIKAIKDKVNTCTSGNFIFQLKREDTEAIKMTLNEFKMMIHDPLYTGVYDTQKMYDPHNMDRPLNDYYINSTHNTYLTGHQLTGLSSVEMYNYVLLNGCRLVELDCYDGSPENGPVVTHGYTFTSKILMKDVLIDMRKNAFIASPYPVILSIENHCSEAQQKIMAEYFQTYLQDLYIIDRKNPPKYYPSPNELKGKFIVKFGGKKLVMDLGLVKPRCEMTYKESETKGIKIWKNTNEIVQKIIPTTSAITIIENASSKNTNAIDITKENRKELKKNQEPIKELHKVRGMFSQKFIVGKANSGFYMPWEMVTCKSTKIENYAKNFDTRETLIKFTQNSFLKGYPVHFDSSNYDPVKLWICGAHIAALNAQTTWDHWTLLNKIFFLKNQNNGYILKPKKFLPESFFIEQYEKPYGTLEMTLLSAFNLHLILSKMKMKVEKQFELKLYTWIVGSFEDDKNNTIYCSDIIGNLLMPQIHTECPFIFSIYEKELSFINLKLEYNGTVIGRGVIPLEIMNEGYRSVALYDNYSEEFIGSSLLFKITKNY